MATKEELDKIYKEELGRGVDRSGTQTYSGMNADQVRSALRSSQEYKNKKGGAKEEQKVSSPGGGRINKDSLNRLTTEILGRNATAAEINHYTSQNLSEGFVAQELALSSKARERGIDPTNYGAKEVDPNSLSEEQKKYYNVWKKIHPNRAFYSTDLQALKWRQSAGSAEAYEQSRLGNIREIRGEDGSKQIVINQKAIQALGPDLSSHVKGNEKGWSVLSAGSYRNKDGTTTAVTFGKNFGKASELKNEEGKPYQGLEGYVGTVTTGNQKDNSIVGELTELTGSEDLAKALTVAVMPFTAPTVYGSDQLQFLADPFGAYSGIVSKEAGESITKGGAKLTGLEEKDIAVAQQVGQVAVSIVNPAAGAAIAMAKAASNYGMGYTSFGDAIVDIGVASVAFIPGAGALGSLGASFAGEMIKGAEFQDAAKNAAWSVAGSSTFGLSNLARAYTDDQFAKNPDGSINWLQVGLSSAPQVVSGFQTYRTANVDGKQVSYSPFSSVSDYGSAVSQKLGSYNPMNTANFYSRQTGAAGINMQRFLRVLS